MNSRQLMNSRSWRSKLNFIFGRILSSIATMFLVSILCFLSFSVIRGDPAVSMAGTNASSEYIEMLREEMGLNKNVFARYFDWLFKFIKGDAGNSYRYKMSVSLLIKERFPVTMSLTLLCLFFIILTALPVSVLTVKRKNSILGGIIDRIANIFTAVGMSIPGFFLGLLIIWFFSLVLKVFQIGVYIDHSENFFGFLGSLCLPALAIAIPNSCILIKFLRGSIYTELKSDYVRTAKSKGAGSFYILIHHVLRNALMPAITIFGMIIGEILCGSIIIEQVFSIPGLGRLLLAAITSRDYPLIQALMVYIAFIIVLANTLADIAIMLVDPRIRMTRPLAQQITRQDKQVV